MKRKPWQKDELRITTDLIQGEWYRSPWYDEDHLVGRTPEHFNTGLAWCGRALIELRDWDEDSLGGLWASTRTSGRCAECARRDREYAEG